uniref:Uncharacterized protein LOC100187278 n=1 Tax=Phallusia mammillata TaxID=59560 RepID=A0A6F9DIN0_9ASCI|nr:uncharacterized protein LOC100187278 [Phallusia mammillata]
MACPKVDFILGPAILIYLATAITEIVSSVPVGLMQDDFKGHCILSGKAEYQANKTMYVASFGSASTCEFCTYLTIVTVLFPLLYGGYTFYALYNSMENASQMWVLPAMMFNALLLVLKFISSCVLSVGVSQFCATVKGGTIKSCKDGQTVPKEWYFVDKTEYVKLDGSNFYSYSTTAQSASWFCVFEWFLLSGLALLHYRRNRALRSEGSTVGPPATNAGFGSSRDTAGIVANEVLPGNSIINPNYKE